MIPCQVCGKDASLNWVAGFPPAPDSMKMGLCSEHDSKVMREKVFKAWQKMLAKSIQLSSLDNFKKEKKVNVLFSSGSSMSFLCIKCEPTQHNTLQIMEKTGESTFIPLDKIRSYTVKETLG